jgi:hypothetical protein
MFGEHHYDLAKEFPEFKGKIHDLKVSNKVFADLYEEYQGVDKEIYRIEEQIETPSDDYTEQLKKKRVTLKDELYQILKSS